MGAIAWPLASAWWSASASSSADPGCTLSRGKTWSIAKVSMLTCWDPSGELPPYGAPATGKDLQAPPCGREHLARVAQSRRIKRILDAEHLRHVLLRKDEWHQVLFLHANTVLAAQRATCRGAHAHDLGARVDDPLFGAGYIGIPQDQRMEI